MGISLDLWLPQGASAPTSTDVESESSRHRSTPSRPLAPARQALSAILDLVLPPLCPVCRGRIAATGALCAECWRKLRFIERPYCERNGTPFAYDLGPGALSAEAIATPPAYDRARAVVVFDTVARDLVHALKYSDRTELAQTLGLWMARAGREILADADLIVPVPLHRFRLWRRRFNQAALLSACIARESGRPWCSTALARRRPTRQQVGLTRNARADNVRGAFHVPEREKARISGRRLVLIDDVQTTGATVEAATRVLKRAGAARVDVLVFARVITTGG